MATPKARILCTEDDLDTREMIAVILETEGYEVVTTHSPDDAIALAKSQQFDLFLMDSWIPGLSGAQLCEELRKFDVKTPVLFYSGAAYETDQEKARSAGAQGYLIKPVGADELIAEVIRVIAESKIAFPVDLVIP